jgi:hypothetical protein
VYQIEEIAVREGSGRIYLEDLTGFWRKEYVVTDPDGNPAELPTTMVDNETTIVTVINRFLPGDGFVMISKDFDGFYEDWDMGDEDVFYALVYRSVNDVEELNPLWFLQNEDGAFVYIDAPQSYLDTVPAGTVAVQVIPFSGEFPALLLGLNTYFPPYSYRIVEVDSEGDDLLADTEIGFAPLPPVIVRDGDNEEHIFVTVTNVFLPVFRVTYDANGGTINGNATMPDPNNPYMEGATVIVISDAPVRANHRFLGWFIDGTDELLQAGDEFTMPAAHVILIAQWEFIPGGGNGGDPPPGGFFVDEHIWYLRGYRESTLRGQPVTAGLSYGNAEPYIEVISPNHFTMRPDNNITRAEVAVAFYRLLRPEFKDFVPDPNPFDDVTGREWYGLAIGILTYHGIFEGNGGRFRPNDPITRRELAVVVTRFDNLPDSNVNPYSDLDPRDWAFRSILAATARGWFIGFPDGTFRPGENLTRAEFATATNRVLERRILPEHLPDDIVRFIDLDESHWAFADFKEAAHSHDWELHDNGVTERWLEITGHGLDAPYNQ